MLMFKQHHLIRQVQNIRSKVHSHHLNSDTEASPGCSSLIHNSAFMQVPRNIALKPNSHV